MRRPDRLFPHLISLLISSRFALLPTGAAVGGQDGIEVPVVEHSSNSADNALDRRVRPLLAGLRGHAGAVESGGDRAVGLPFPTQAAHESQGVLLGRAFDQATARSEVPAEGRKPADALAAGPLDLQRGSRP